MQRSTLSLVRFPEMNGRIQTGVHSSACQSSAVEIGDALITVLLAAERMRQSSRATIWPDRAVRTRPGRRSRFERLEKELHQTLSLLKLNGWQFPC
jgi:hypothetical protein